MTVLPVVQKAQLRDLFGSIKKEFVEKDKGSLEVDGSSSCIRVEGSR